MFGMSCILNALKVSLVSHYQGLSYKALLVVLCLISNSPLSFASMYHLWQEEAEHWRLDRALLNDEMAHDFQHNQITLPHPDGTLHTYSMQRITISPHASEHNIHTFSLHSLDEENALQAGRLSIFQGKLKAFIETNTQSIYIEPIIVEQHTLSDNSDQSDETIYRSFSRESSHQARIFDALATALKQNTPSDNIDFTANKSSDDTHFSCLTDDPNHHHITGNKGLSNKDGGTSTNEALSENTTTATLANKKFGDQLHKYRLALSATHEYNMRVGNGNKAATYAEMVHAISRVNAIFERDFAIRLVLVSNTNLIASNSSSYSEGNVVDMLGQNQQRTDQIVGYNNYDIGHVLGVSGGGIASLASACSSRKAQGVSASSSPTGTIFYVDYLAHELAHQLSATHTFNADGEQSGVCQGNRVESGSSIFQSSAYEVGSGSTIMSYAGLCSQQNIQYSADDYFHAKSIEQVRNFSEGRYSSYNGSCGSYENTSNNPPTVSAGSQYTIPVGTPFLLTASGNDIDNSNSAITYTWEQYDLGGHTSDRNDMHSDKGLGPLIRSVEGTTSPSRSIPSKKDILLGNFIRTHGIRLPIVARDLNFRVTARSGNYGVDQDDVKISVFRSEHPFALVQPNGNVTLTSNHNTAVSWITGYTEQAPVNCKQVNIKLSTDGGNSFPHILASNTNNDGYQKVHLPNITSHAARVKISCSNNIFFSISDTSFSIQPSNKPKISMKTNTPRLNEGNSNNSNPVFSYTVEMSSPLAHDINLNYSIDNAGKHITYAGVVDSNVLSHHDFPSVSSGLPSGSVRLRAGETSKTFTIEVSADDSDEFDEYFQVILNETPHADFAIHHALAVIVSEEKPDYISATASNAEESKPQARNLSSGSISWFGLLLSSALLAYRKRDTAIKVSKS